MKALTDSEFGDFLDEELSWRRAELHLLKNEVREAARSPDSPRARASSRALAVLSYAHWEGFVKTTFDKLAEVVARRRPSLTRSAEAFVVAHMKHLLLRVSSGDADARDELVRLARGEAGRLRLRKDDLVRTRDNLRFEYLVEILTGFGLDASDLELSRNFIDHALCDQRNVVAHGRSSFPDPGSVIEAADRVLELLERIAHLERSLLQGKRYLVSAETGQ